MLISRIKSKLEFKLLRIFKKYGERMLLIEAMEKCSRPVFIYQMGKVGSKSIKESLQATYTEPIVHGHGFSHNFHNWKIRILYQFFAKGKPINIITLTREPVSRNVSHFFQKYKGSLTVSVDDLLKLFMKTHDHELATNWFDENIKKNFGIDIYEKEMPDSGYQVYERGRIRILLIKVETDDDIIVNAVKTFLGIDEFSLTNHNISANKNYGKLYNKFVKKARLPKEYIRARISDRYFKHFYDESVADAIWNKWYDGKPL